MNLVSSRPAMSESQSAEGVTSDNTTSATLTIPSTPASETSELLCGMNDGLFVGFLIVEFDTVSGEKVAFKQFTREMNEGVEKELVGMLLGYDYCEGTECAIVRYTISDFHTIV